MSYKIAVSLAALALLSASPAQAQAPGIGQLEIKAYETIPKTKTAVQLSSDTHLSRELRRAVMVRGGAARQ